MSAVRGRIRLDFNGNACEGYSLQFRQVSELDTGEGKVSTSDLRSTTWEDGDAKKLHLPVGKLPQREPRQFRRRPGRAWHRAIGGPLTKPKDAKLDLDAGVVFPTEHDGARSSRRPAPARAYFNFRSMTGSDNGEKVYDTLTVIGRGSRRTNASPPTPRPDEPKLAGVAALAGHGQLFR